MDHKTKKHHKRKKETMKDDRWILPAVNCRIKNDTEKKSRHEKKHRKQKHKSKLEKIENSNSSSQSEENEETEWVESESIDSKKSVQDESKSQRDAWMIIPNLGPTFSKADLERETKKKAEKRNSSPEPGYHERELNPYWRSGGTGLPPTGENIDSFSASRVGDGGYQWLQKAYQRALEQAEEQGRPLEEIARERWGSLEKLQTLLELSKKRVYDKEDYSNQKSSSHHFSSKHSRKRTSKEPSASFSKPSNDEQETGTQIPPDYHEKTKALGNWKKPSWKKVENVVEEPNIEKEFTPTNEQPNQVQEPLTDDQMNQLAAQILKAELMDDKTLVEKLKSQLESARKMRKFGDKMDKEEEEDSIVLTEVNRKGVTKPFTASSSDPYGKRAKKKKVDSYDAQGMRSHYFADDNKYSLQEMFEREKTTTAEEQNSLFSRLAKNKGLKNDDDFDVDDMFIKDSRQMEAEDSWQKLNQVKNASAKRNEILNKCHYCFGNPKLQKHLIIAIATKVYLRVPHHHSLTSGHCQIIPMNHEIASTHLDEDVWEEIEVFKKTLTNMFESLNKDTIFFETSMNRKHLPHMIIECIPLPKEDGSLVPMYFKKAIMESEYEWSNNKKLITLGQKDIRKAVPKELPYFCINYNINEGFAHVIEDERLFPWHFAQEIIAGMLDLDPQDWRKPKKESFEEQRQKVLKFAEFWKPFDWTQDI